MSYLNDEIASQPRCWSRAIELAGSAEFALPGPGERVAAIGCGSSLNVARCYAALREAAGQGETDAFPASEVPAAPRDDRLLYIFRPGPPPPPPPGRPAPPGAPPRRAARLRRRTLRGLQPVHHQLDRAAPCPPGDSCPVPAGRGRARGGPPVAAGIG